MASISGEIEHVQQPNVGACLPACIRMVLDYHGRTVRVRRLAKVIGTITDYGTPFSRIVRLRKIGIDVTFGQGDFDILRGYLAEDRPCITSVHTSELPYTDESTLHAVIVVKIAHGIVHLHDPMLPYAPVQVSWGDFDLAWLKGREKYAVIVP